MNILFFDTSQGVTSICMSVENIIQNIFNDNQPNRQAELLVTQINDYILQHNMKWHDFDIIACINGVGGFTSVRIGVATARGLAMAGGIKAVGIDMMQLMAFYYFKHNNTAKLQCVIPAGNKFIASQNFNQTYLNYEKMQVIEKQNFKITENMCVLPSISEYKSMIFPLENSAKIGIEMLLENNNFNYSAPVPLYARPADAKIGKPLLKANQ